MIKYCHIAYPLLENWCQVLISDALSSILSSTSSLTLPSTRPPALGFVSPALGATETQGAQSVLKALLDQQPESPAKVKSSKTGCAQITDNWVHFSFCICLKFHQIESINKSKGGHSWKPRQHISWDSALQSW